MQVDNKEDRSNIVRILAFAGYKVSIKDIFKPRFPYEDVCSYFVIVEKDDTPIYNTSFHKVNKVDISELIN